MATYFDYLLIRNNYDYKKTYREFIGNSTSESAKSKTSKDNIHLSENITISKNLIDKYSIETYLAKGHTIGDWRDDPKMGKLKEQDGNRLVFTDYHSAIGSGFSYFKHEIKDILDSGRLKISLDSLHYLIQIGILTEDEESVEEVKSLNKTSFFE